MSPEGKNGYMEAVWDGSVVQRYDFDNYEDHDCHKPSPPSQDHESLGHHGGGGVNLEASAGILGSGEKLSEEAPREMRVFGPFSTGPLTNASDGGPLLGRKDTADFRVASGRLVAAAAESKTFITWEHRPKWELQSGDGRVVAVLDQLIVTLVRAPDPQTGNLVVFATVEFRQTSKGWQIFPNHPVTLRILLQNEQNGLLEEWGVATTHVVSCGDAEEYRTYKQTFRPDWYDLLTRAVVIINPAKWHVC